MQEPKKIRGTRDDADPAWLSPKRLDRLLAAIDGFDLWSRDKGCSGPGEGPPDHSAPRDDA